MLQKSYYFLLLIILTTGCKLLDKKTEQGSALGSWRLYKINSIEGNDTKESDDKLLDQAKLNDRVQTGLLLSLFDDNTFTRVTGDQKYEFGKWEAPADYSRIILQQPGSIRQQYSLSFGKQNEHDMLQLSDSMLHENLIFVREALPLKDKNDDPFYTSNNKWRLHGEKPAIDAEIKEKLANYIKHYACILKAALELKKQVVSFEFSQGMITIYNGGIGIIPIDKLTPDWVHNFFNEKDAIKAYTMYDELLSHSHFKGASTGSWIEDDYNILLILYGNINK